MHNQYNNIRYNIVICRYNEVFLKGKNKNYFQSLIIKRAYELIKNEINEIKIEEYNNNIIIKLKDFLFFKHNQIKTIEDKIKYIPGIQSYSVAIIIKKYDIPLFQEIALQFTKNIIEKFQDLYNNCNLKFRIRVHRIEKNGLSTKQIEIKIADHVIQNFPKLVVDLSQNANISIYFEIHKEFIYIFNKKINTVGGLPVDKKNSALVMISGGFDSPVASYLAMKRGIWVDYIFFHSYPITPTSTIEKIKNIVKILNKYQGNSKIFICNILEIQKIIITKTLEKFRTIHFRRVMLKIAELIAKINNNKAIITGDSIGQVASQTLTNLDIISNGIESIVIRPLITNDKSEIIQIANQIKTYDISKIQSQESCTIFLSKSPSTKANKQKILQYEKDINIDNLIKKMYNKIIVFDVKNNQEYNINEYFSNNKK